MNRKMKELSGNLQNFDKMEIQKKIHIYTSDSSLWRDLNSRLPPYQGGTLPGCVTQAIIEQSLMGFTARIFYPKESLLQIA